VPASIVQKVVNLHRAQLQGLIELGSIRKMRKVYEDIRAQIEAELASLQRAGKSDTFSAHHARVILLQVRDGLREFQRQFGSQLNHDGEAAAVLAQCHTVNAIKQFERRFTGTEPILRLEEAAVFRGVYRGVEPTLLDRYHKLVGNYPMETIVRVKNQLAVSMLGGQGVDQTVRQIASKGGVFDRERWRAERIVRTESSYAYGQTGQRCLGEVAKEVPQLMKRLVATQDDREGEDSKQLDGQTVPWDKPFVWMKKTKHGVERVEYMAPPNRPNDRETVVPWRQEYHGAISGTPIDPRMPPRSAITPP